MKIIALLDASVYAKSVCDHVAWIATRTGAAVDVVHVLGRRETTTVTPNLSGSLEMNANAVLLEELAEFDRQKARVAQERGRLIVDQAKAVLLAAGVASDTPRLRTGDLVETIHELETEADLIVIGRAPILPSCIWGRTSSGWFDRATSRCSSRHAPSSPYRGS